jgi:acetamidase/formamidase
VQATEHRLTQQHRHFQWDRRLPPAIRVRSGDVIRLETQEVSGGQVRPGDPADAVVRMDRSRVYPLTGPIYVEEARPGDVLAIEMLEVSTGTWGWTANIPGRGLLADEFPDPYIRYFRLDGGAAVPFADGITLPLAPFFGTIGVAPDVDGPLPVRPPHAGGGNIDTRQLSEGSTLYLPVLNEGGLLSAGDGHAAQGDGEVCVTGIECDLTATIRVSVLRNRSLKPGTYQLETVDGQRPQTTRSIGLSASGPDLKEDARDAVRALIEWLQRERRLSRVDAYLLCSLAADLRISQVVNEPNYCVTALLPLALFDGEAGRG